jgi:hypothetical protein
MIVHGMSIGIRNILLIQLVIVLMVPDHAVLVRQELIRIWKSINAPLLRKKETRKKGSRFWEIDMTAFEP